jgi:LAO/AO transport system kinase
VLTTSALEGSGLDEFWAEVVRHRTVLTEAGELVERRRRQQVDWMWSMVREALEDRLAKHPAVRAVRRQVERAVRDGEITSAAGADRILAEFDR